jgi:hypothetical protein
LLSSLEIFSAHDSGQGAVSHRRDKIGTMKNLILVPLVLFISTQTLAAGNTPAATVAVAAATGSGYSDRRENYEYYAPRGADPLSKYLKMRKLRFDADPDQILGDYLSEAKKLEYSIRTNAGGAPEWHLNQSLNPSFIVAFGFQPPPTNSSSEQLEDAKQKLALALPQRKKGYYQINVAGYEKFIVLDSNGIPVSETPTGRLFDTRYAGLAGYNPEYFDGVCTALAR